MSLPRTSVIIPTYNRAADLVRCLRSLSRQTDADFEVLVCDDGSTDDTARVVAGFEAALPVRYLRQDNFGGPARPRNNGLRHACGEYVAFLDSDDWWHPEKLERSVARLAAGADIVYHDLYLVTGAADIDRKSWRRAATRKVTSPVFDDMLFNGNAINTSSVVTRRELMLAIGGFSEERALIAGEDYDAWLRLARKTDRFERIDIPLGSYWAGGGSISAPVRTIAIMNRLQELYREDLDRVAQGALPPLMAYNLSRAHYQLKAFDKAIVYAQSALGGKLPLWLRVKATATLGLSRFGLARC